VIVNKSNRYQVWKALEDQKDQKNKQHQILSTIAKNRKKWNNVLKRKETTANVPRNKSHQFIKERF